MVHSVIQYCYFICLLTLYVDLLVLHSLNTVYVCVRVSRFVSDTNSASLRRDRATLTTRSRASRGQRRSILPPLWWSTRAEGWRASTFAVKHPTGETVRVRLLFTRLTLKRMREGALSRFLTRAYACVYTDSKTILVLGNGGDRNSSSY